ncbi:Chaperone dnaK2 [Paramuricea clavata]|uniref:Chaperone dnaK2 n=1 Tax=Paramuricea clavata TaxID=317549 RepID=A0A7D9IQ60_PARCT|nr:Chaperone dnaK2 [Paramuricea clavata]
MEIKDPKDDVIELNVGGTIMATKRSTLCQVKDSFLTSMFGGSWDETKMARDKDGHVFLDFNPKYFAVILDYLREKAYTTSEAPLALSRFAPEEVESFIKLVDYLGLSLNEMRKLPTTEEFELQYGAAKVDENGAVAMTKNMVHCNNAGGVFGKNIYERGVFRIKLNLEKMNFLDGDTEVRIGMVKEKLENDKEDYFSSPVAFCGWGITRPVRGRDHELLKRYNSGKIDTEADVILEREYAFKGGKMVELILNCDAAKLYLNTEGCYQFHVDLPKLTRYRLMVQYIYGDFKIRIVDFHNS